MNWTKLLLLIPLYLLTAGSTGADPQQAKTIIHSSSPCAVSSSAGEYPMYSATKDGRVLYSPKSDGILQAVFSPSGRYIAFVGSEIDWVDIRPGEGHSIVILDCETEQLSGFSKGFPMGDFKWVDDRHFQYTDTATESLVRGEHSIKGNLRR